MLHCIIKQSYRLSHKSRNLSTALFSVRKSESLVGPYNTPKVNNLQLSLNYIIWTFNCNVLRMDKEQ